MTNEMVLKNSQKNLVMPKHYIELDSEEMNYIEGGDYWISKSTCITILSITGAVAYFGSIAAIIAGGTALYYTICSLMASATLALSANPVTAPIGLVIAGFLIKKGVEFVTCLVGGAVNNGMCIETIKIFGLDTHIPNLSFYY